MRNMKSNEEEKGEFVLVSEKFFNDLKETDFFSSIKYLFKCTIEKPGKGVYLLQKKIMKRKMLKARRQHDLAIEHQEMIKGNHDN